MGQEFFIYNDRPKWSPDIPRRVMDGKSVWFRAVVGYAGRTGVKTHIGSVDVVEFDDGHLHFWGARTRCSVGTHTRGGGAVSGPRDIHDFTVFGKPEITCQTKHCQNAAGVDLDALNRTAWIEIRTWYGLPPHFHHI